MLPHSSPQTTLSALTSLPSTQDQCPLGCPAQSALALDLQNASCPLVSILYDSCFSSPIIEAQLLCFYFWQGFFSIWLWPHLSRVHPCHLLILILSFVVYRSSSLSFHWYFYLFLHYLLVLLILSPLFCIWPSLSYTYYLGDLRLFSLTAFLPRPLEVSPCCWTHAKEQIHLLLQMRQLQSQIESDSRRQWSQQLSTAILTIPPYL